MAAVVSGDNVLFVSTELSALVIVELLLEEDRALSEGAFLQPEKVKAKSSSAIIRIIIAAGIIFVFNFFTFILFLAPSLLFLIIFLNFFLL